MLAVWEYEEDSWRFISYVKSIKDLFKVRWKGIPQMCPTVAQTTFQKISTGLRQSQFVLTISKSIVRAGGMV